MPDETLNAVVSQRIQVTPDLIILRVVPDAWDFPKFKPGQYVLIGLPWSAPSAPFCDPEPPPENPPRILSRAYSIASSSVYREFIEFYVTLVRSGALTPRIFALEPGDRMWIGRKIVGMFTLNQVPSDEHVVLIATGTGLAPYMSMLRSVFVCGSERHFVVVHGARHSWDLGYRAELSSMARMCSNMLYLPIVSRPKEEHIEWKGLTGHIQDIWNGDAVERAWGRKPSPEDTHIFLCGNPAMVNDMIEILKNDGYSVHSKRKPGQIHVEKYW